MSKWRGRETDIRRMVTAGLNDAQIGDVYDVTAASICRIRKELGIPTQFKRKPPTYFGAATQVPLLGGETYVDGAGLIVTRYPVRYAAGAEMQAVTARARR